MFTFTDDTYMKNIQQTSIGGCLVDVISAHYNTLGLCCVLRFLKFLKIKTRFNSFFLFCNVF